MDKFSELKSILQAKFGVEQDLTSVLYLIGVQELGRGFEKFSQEEKMDLIDMAKAKLLSKLGFFVEKGRDENGWLIFERSDDYSQLLSANKNLSLHDLVVEYFENQGII